MHLISAVNYISTGAVHWLEEERKEGGGRGEVGIIALENGEGEGGGG